MGKKISNAKPVTPPKRVAKTKPTAEKPPLPEPAATKPETALVKSKPAPRKAKAPTPRAKKSPYSQDDIALRAYFISERRQAAGLPGDAHHDWIEAERQLASEAKKTVKAKSRKS